MMANRFVARSVVAVTTVVRRRPRHCSRWLSAIDSSSSSSSLSSITFTFHHPRRWLSDTTTTTTTDTKQQASEEEPSADDAKTTTDSTASSSSTLDLSRFTQEIEVRMPEMGVGDGKIIKWYKEEGDIIRFEDVICDIETSEFSFGMSSEDEGPSILKKILVDAPSGPIPEKQVICTLLHEVREKKKKQQQKSEEEVKAE